MPLDYHLKQICLNCPNTINHSAMTYCYFCTCQLFNNPEYKTHVLKFIKSCIRKKIIKKRLCELCGDKKVQLHIHNYFKPLDVRWLCKNHHNDEHNWNKDFLESKLC
jgi:hypothetical protein